eukprot:GEMP01021704.1.p1 GENE.GEMP01021704.1~~GEMP01021704.1.p1  ORF type:complete len:810 (-),score=177.55 GEMP01021704.1:67-2496(-)
MIWVDLKSGLCCHDYESKLRHLGSAKTDSNETADGRGMGRRLPTFKNGETTNGLFGPNERKQSIAEEAEAPEEQDLDLMAKKRLDDLFRPVWQRIQTFKAERELGVDPRLEFSENNGLALITVLQSARAPPIPLSFARGLTPRRPHTAPLGKALPSHTPSPPHAHKKTTGSSRPHTASGKPPLYITALSRTGKNTQPGSTACSPDVSARKQARSSKGPMTGRQSSNGWHTSSPDAGYRTTNAFSSLTVHSMKGRSTYRKRSIREHFDSLLQAQSEATECAERRQIKVEDVKWHCYLDFEEVAVGEKESKNARSHFLKLAKAGGEDRMLISTELAKQMKKIGLADAHIQRVMSFFKMPEKLRLASYLARFQLFFTKKLSAKQQLCFHLLDADGDRVLSARDLFAILNSIGTDAGRYAHQRAHTWESPMAFKEVMFRPEDEIGIDVDIKAYPPEVVAVDQAKRGYREGIRTGDRILSVNGVPAQENEFLHAMTAQRTEPLVLRLCTYQWTLRGDGFAVGAISTGDFENLWHAYLSKCSRSIGASLTLSDFQNLFGDSVPDFYNMLRTFFVGTQEPEIRSRAWNAEEKAETQEKVNVTSEALHAVPEVLVEISVGTTLAYRHALARAFGYFQKDGQQFIELTSFTAKSSMMFGFAMPRLAGRLFRLLAGDDPVITLENWANKWTAWSYGPLDLAFRIYDIDGDGIISIDDVEVIRCDREEVQGSELEPVNFADASQRPLLQEWWNELHWLYSFVCETVFEDERETVIQPKQIRGVPLGLFQQLLPRTRLLDQLEIGLGFRFRTLILSRSSQS